MLIRVILPWHQAMRLGRWYDVLHVNLTPSELDGEVCTEGQAISVIDGAPHKLPPYIAAKDIPGLLGAAMGPEFGAFQTIQDPGVN